MIVAASFSAAFESCFGSSTRKGWGSRSRGTAMITVLPSSSASRRAWVCGESGFALITRARFQSRWPASFSAASLAPAKLGIRPSAPGKRETPSRSIAFQTSLRTSSLERIARNISDAHRPLTASVLPECARMAPSAPHSPEVAEAPRRRSCPGPPRAPSACATLLPAIEPERRIDDWGRSERVEGFFDRTLVEFFYRYWFRAEVEGIENVPAEGGALLVSNHSGALPPDAAMIARAIREEHPSPRPLNITVEHFFKGYPVFSMLIPKIGCVAAHPANVHRLLYDEQQLVLVFPEGRKGTEKVYKRALPAAPLRPRRLRRPRRCGREAKLVPVCVVGAEEAAPIFAQVGLLQRLTGLLYFPLTPTFPWLGPLGMLGYLPAKFRIRFLEPIDTAELGRRRRRRQGAGADGRPGGPGADPGEPARDGRAAEVGVVRMTVARPRRQRSSSPGSPPTGAGGSPRRSRPSPRSRRSSASTRASRPGSSSAPSTSRSATSTR